MQAGLHQNFTFFYDTQTDNFANDAELEASSPVSVCDAGPCTTAASAWPAPPSVYGFLRKAVDAPPRTRSPARDVRYVDDFRWP